MKTPEHKLFYEAATKRILAQLDSLGLPADKKQHAVKLVNLFRESFTHDDIKKATFITTHNKIWDFGYDSGGFCRVASITFAIAMNLYDWQLMFIGTDKWVMPHHYLKHIPSGKFFDITYDQFAIKNLTVPYELGQNAIYNLSPTDNTLKFAKSVGLDIIKMLIETQDK